MEVRKQAGAVRVMFLLEKQHVHMPEAGGRLELQAWQAGQYCWRGVRWWGDQGRKGGRSEGGSYTALEVITGAPQDRCTMCTAPNQARELRLKFSLWIPLARHSGLGLLLLRPRGACVSFTSRCCGGQWKPKALTSTSSEKRRHWRTFSREGCAHCQFIALSTLAYPVLGWLYVYFILKNKDTTSYGSGVKR